MLTGAFFGVNHSADKKAMGCIINGISCLVPEKLGPYLSSGRKNKIENFNDIYKMWQQGRESFRVCVRLTGKKDIGRAVVKLASTLKIK